MDYRSLGEIFLLFTDELADITFGESFRLILQVMFESICAVFNATNNQIAALIDIFVDHLPEYMKNALVKSATYAT